MVSLADRIEQHILQMLEETANGILEFRRIDLANSFFCVPSQINYVLETRFSPDAGYQVETKRGGGGSVKIIRLDLDSEDEIYELLRQTTDHGLSQQATERLLHRLVSEEFLTQREGKILTTLTDNATLQVSVADGDLLRSRIVRNILLNLLREDY